MGIDGSHVFRPVLSSPMRSARHVLEGRELSLCRHESQSAGGVLCDKV
jgi:hypothetical protein